MAVPTTRNANDKPADAIKRTKAPALPPEKRPVRVRIEHLLRIVLGAPRSVAELVDDVDERDVGTLMKALKSLEKQGVVHKVDGKWARK